MRERHFCCIPKYVRTQAQYHALGTITITKVESRVIAELGVARGVEGRDRTIATRVLKWEMYHNIIVNTIAFGEIKGFQNLADDEQSLFCHSCENRKSQLPFFETILNPN